MTPVYHIVARSRVVKKHMKIRREHTTEARYDTTIIQHKHTMIIGLGRCPDRGRLISMNVPVDDCRLIAALGGLLPGNFRQLSSEEVIEHQNRLHSPKTAYRVILKKVSFGIFKPSWFSRKEKILLLNATTKGYL